MKIRLASILCLLWVSVAQADYDGLNQARETYAPPDFFTRFVQPGPDKPGATGEIQQKNLEENQNQSPTGHPSGQDLANAPVLAMKRLHQQMLESDEIPFLPESDALLKRSLATLADDPPAVQARIEKTIVLKELELLSALRNPGVLAARQQAKAEITTYDQVMGLDDSLRQYEKLTQGLNNQAGPVPMKSSIRQGWPFPGLTGLKGRIVREQVAIAFERLNIVQKDIITLARKTYWDLVLVDESAKSTAETIDALIRLRDVATSLYRSGKTSFQDVIKINIKVSVLEEDLVTLAAQRRSVEASVLELLNLPAGVRVGRTAPASAHKKIPLPAALVALARENRQELKLIHHQIAKVENMVEMAESMIQEPFTLGLSLSENEAVTMTGTDAPKQAFAEKTMAAMKNNQPIKSWYGVSEPWLGQTRQMLEGLRQTRIKEEKAADRMVQEAWVMVDQNQRELALYATRILDLSKSALDVSDREYESGSIPFSQAIDSYTYWLTVKLTIAKKQSGLGISIAALEKMMGKTL